MADYKQNTVVGTEWQRSHHINIMNPIQGDKVIQFSEQRVANMGTWYAEKEVPGCRVAFSPLGSFPILDPNTNEPTGAVMTHTELYIALYSLYMQTALLRDAEVAAAASSTT